MLIQKKPDLTYADVTPKALYMGRRNFLLGLLATTAVVAGWKKLPRMFAGPATGSVPVKLERPGEQQIHDHRRENHARKRRHHLQQFLRVRHGQGRPVAERQEFRHHALERLRRRRSRQAAQVHHGRNPEARAARRAHLPPSLRRGLVDRRAVDRLFPQHDRQSRRAHVQGPLRRFRELLRSAPNAVGLGRWHPASLRRGLAPRRSDESAHAALRRHVRRDASESGRRAGAHGDSLEVRIQEHQIHRQDPLREERARRPLGISTRRTNTASTPT